MSKVYPLYRFFIIILFVVLLFHNCSSNRVDMDQLKKITNDINTRCPQMIDSETMLDSVEFKIPNTIVYHHTLNVLKQNVDTHQFYLNMWPGLLSFIKVNVALEQMRQNKVNFEYLYKDKSKELIYNFKLSPKDYNP